jgi:hypothetical protein
MDILLKAIDLKAEGLIDDVEEFINTKFNTKKNASC